MTIKIIKMMILVDKRIKKRWCKASACVQSDLPLTLESQPDSAMRGVNLCAVDLIRTRGAARWSNVSLWSANFRKKLVEIRAPVPVVCCIESKKAGAV